jgi:hypothetical protein
MAQPTKIVKGGFRATLALIIAFVALMLSFLAYTASHKEEGLKAQIKDLQTTIEKMKAESADRLNKLRNETSKALEKMSKAVKKEEMPEEGAGGSIGGAKN